VHHILKDGGMDSDQALQLIDVSKERRRWRFARFAGPIVCLIVLGLLLADRYRYLTHFGFIYTDGDQTTFWYQADDLSRGIFREPCLYGQAYNPPVEAWVAVPLLWLHVPAYVALPLVTVILALLPFAVLAGLAYRRGHPWGAALVLLIPLALPIEYTVVSSLPRGFVNGLAVATPTVALWLFYRSRKAFFVAGFCAVLALTINPNSSIVLLMAGVYALLMNFRALRFYLFTAIGAIAALPAPLLIRLFYVYHPECDAYRPKLVTRFSWDLLKESIVRSGRHGITLNHWDLDLFFADFVPIVQRGWIILIILPALVVALLLVRRIKAAVVTLIASCFAIACVGIERVHSADNNVFYSGTRMYLALPILFAAALLWFDLGLGECCKGKRLRFIPPVIRGVLILSLAAFAYWRHTEFLDPPSHFVTGSFLPPVEEVRQLTEDTDAVAAACRKYDVSLVLVSRGPYSCFNDGAPVLSHHAFETLYPSFERRTFRVAAERTHLHTAVLVYYPGFFETALAISKFPGAKMISHSPELLLIPIAAPGRAGFDVLTDLGMVYRPQM
jgi:hypothetical protein